MHQESDIHPTSVVYPGAVIGKGCTVGPYSVIGSHVEIGPETVIGPHVVLEGHTKIGSKNRIFQFASVGAIPQDLKYHGEASELIIGDGNIIREYVTLQPGTSGGGMITKIGDRNLFMANTHVGHDSMVGNGCVFANSVAVAGHVTIGSYVILGGLVGIHQFVRLGDLAIIGAGAMVSKDIPPFCVAQGDRARLGGVNRLGLDRAKISKDDQITIRRAYRTLFVEKSSAGIRERVEMIRASTENNPHVEKLLSFILEAKRGVPKHRSSASEDSEG